MIAVSNMDRRKESYGQYDNSHKRRQSPKAFVSLFIAVRHLIKYRIAFKCGHHMTCTSNWFDNTV